MSVGRLSSFGATFLFAIIISPQIIKVNPQIREYPLSTQDFFPGLIGVYGEFLSFHDQSELAVVVDLPEAIIRFNIPVEVGICLSTYKVIRGDWYCHR